MTSPTDFSYEMTKTKHPDEHQELMAEGWEPFAIIPDTGPGHPLHEIWYRRRVARA